MALWLPQLSAVADSASAEATLLSHPNNQKLTLPPTLAVMLIIDASGSMAAKLDGQVRLDVVKRTLDQIFPLLDHSKIKVGIRAYGFDDTVAKTPEASCPNTALLRPIKTGDVSSLRSAIDSLKPYGYTPLATSLAASAKELAEVEATRHTIVLLSDGVETCGGDPVKIASDLLTSTSGTSISTNVIGFDLNTAGHAELAAIAEAGGGRYFEANNASALGKSLANAIRVAQRGKSAEVRWTRFGKDALTAQSLNTGIYALDSNIGRGEKGWFKVDTQAGQHVLVEGINAADSSQPRGFKLALYDAKSRPIRNRTADVGETVRQGGRVSFLDTAGKGILFSVGSDDHAIEQSPIIALNVRDAWDIRATVEAPASLLSGNVNVRLHRKLNAHLGDGDHADVYFFDIPPGVSRLFLATDFNQPSFGHTVEIFERGGERIARKYGQGRTRMSLSLPPGFNEFALRITDANPREQSVLSPYSFVLTH